MGNDHKNEGYPQIATNTSLPFNHKHQKQEEQIGNFSRQ